MTLGVQSAWLAAAVFAAALAGCGEAGGGDDDNDDGRYDVVATVGMVGDVARNVAGDRADVTDLMGAGVDPHLYKPGRDDIVKLAAADVVLYNGLLLEGKLQDALRRVGEGKPAVAVAEAALGSDRLLTPQQTGAGYGTADPHVWMDPSLWSLVAAEIARILADHDPANAAEYAANLEEYRAELAELRAYGERVMATIPPDRRVLVTSHDAFGYFGRAFDLEVLGVQGLSTESEAGLRRMNDLADLLARRDVRAVFVESSVAAKSLEALVEGAGERGQAVEIGGTLFSDAMGPAGTYEGTYVGMLDHNLTTVARALGGEAPAGGMQGKLSQAGAAGR